MCEFERKLRNLQHVPIMNADKNLNRSNRRVNESNKGASRHEARPPTRNLSAACETAEARTAGGKAVLAVVVARPQVNRVTGVDGMLALSGRGVGHAVVGRPGGRWKHREK